MSIPGMYSGAGPVPGQPSPHSPDRAGAGSIVNTMADPSGYTATPTGGLRPLTSLLAFATLVGSVALVVWRWSRDGATALDVLGSCQVGQVECVVQPAIRAGLLDPLLIGAAMFALSVGAFTDARRRPATGLLLAVAALVLGVLAVTS